MPYVDRATGKLLTDPIYAAGFLGWCYNSRSGRIVTRGLLCRPFVSRLFGWYARRRWTRRKVAPFARKMNVNVEELRQPLAAFGSFADFIARPIDLARRPIDGDPATCVAPADGRLLAYPSLPADANLRIKGGWLDRESLLSDPRLARRFADGAVVVVRLYLADYHHFHFPDAGTPAEPAFVPGRHYAVTPYAPRWDVPFCAENARAITRFASEHFGTMAIVEVGAFAVGSVRQAFTAGRRVAKGEHKGSFELGASLIVLLFEPGAIRLDDDLCSNTRSGLETRVRMGEAIGRAPPRRDAARGLNDSAGR